MASVLAFSGSNSSQSINQKLVEVAASKVIGADVAVISINEFPLPMYSIDREREGIPPNALALMEKVRKADGFIVSCPEHNGTAPAVFKNVIDWLSRIEKKSFGSKPMLLMSTSPGGRGGQTNLEYLAETLMPRWGADVCATFRMGNFYDNYVEDTKSLVPEEDARLTDAVTVFVNRLPLS